MKRLFLILICSIFLGCVGGDDAGQNLGNIFDSSEGLILTEEEHPSGWKREDCFTCHPLNVIHQEDRTELGVLPLEDIQEFVIQEGPDSCVICHGDNGVGE
jgi:hypothetical protein